MKKRKKYIIPVFIPQQGCPFQCIYCNQYAITGANYDILNEVDKVLGQAVEYVPKDTDVEIAFYGGTFTALDKDIQQRLLQMASSYRGRVDIAGIRLSTRPDYIDPSILDMLSCYGVTTIELGAQSMVDDVLKTSGRGHSVKDIEKAAHLIKDYGMQLGIQLMIGLPGDDKGKDMISIFKAIGAGADFVRIYPTLVIKDTPLQRLYFSGRYKPLSINEAVDICADMFCVCTANDVAVIRMGLQSSDGIKLGCDVIAGPFHPAFGELVKSRVYLDAMIALLNQAHYDKNDIAVFKVNQKDLSLVLGQRRCNLRMLEEDFGLGRVKIIPSPNTEVNNIHLKIVPLNKLKLFMSEGNMKSKTMLFSDMNDRADYVKHYNLNIVDYCHNRCQERYGCYVS